jgi:hypothetical protein
MDPNSSNSHVTLCTGSSTVRRTVSKVQPKIIFLVGHVALYFRIFLTKAGSCWCLLSC